MPCVDSAYGYRIRPNAKPEQRPYFSRRWNLCVHRGIGLSFIGTTSKPSLHGGVTQIQYGNDTEISCPFVYTYDGNAFHFESETFAGAVFKGAERSVTMCSRLKPVDGRYLMKLTNERRETEYTNEVALHVVDVFDDTDGTCVIVPDDSGTVSTTHSPDRAGSMQGYERR